MPMPFPGQRYLDRAVLAGRGYVRRGLLGQGTYSDVYCIEDGADGRRYACKVSWRAEMLEREAQVLKEVRIPGRSASARRPPPRLYCPASRP